MRIQQIARKVLLLFPVAVVLSGPAWGQTTDGALQDFLNAKQGAYRSYRSAWFYLRTGNIELAALELSFFLTYPLSDTSRKWLKSTCVAMFLIGN